MSNQKNQASGKLYTKPGRLSLRIYIEVLEHELGVLQSSLEPHATARQAHTALYLIHRVKELLKEENESTENKDN